MSPAWTSLATMSRTMSRATLSDVFMARGSAASPVVMRNALWAGIGTRLRRRAPAGLGSPARRHCVAAGGAGRRRRTPLPFMSPSGSPLCCTFRAAMSPRVPASLLCSGDSLPASDHPGPAARRTCENGRLRSGRGSGGSPSTRSPMMLRWISSEPPAIR